MRKLHDYETGGFGAEIRSAMSKSPSVQVDQRCMVAGIGCLDRIFQGFGQLPGISWIGKK